MSLSSAQRRVSAARDKLNTNRVDEVSPLLDAAEELLAGLDYAEQAPVLAEIAVLRAELENTPSSDDERFLAAARNQLRHARDEFEAGRDRDWVEQSLDRALSYLSNVRSQFHGPILAEATNLRAQLGVPTAVGRAPVSPVAGASDEEHRARRDRAAARVAQAWSLVESRSFEGVEETLAEALDLLAAVPDGMKAQLLSEIDQIRVGHCI